jgi:hypothetical protein
MHVNNLERGFVENLADPAGSLVFITNYMITYISAPYQDWLLFGTSCRMADFITKMA